MSEQSVLRADPSDKPVEIIKAIVAVTGGSEVSWRRKVITPSRATNIQASISSMRLSGR